MSEIDAGTEDTIRNIELAIRLISEGEIDFSGIYDEELNETVSETILKALNFMKQAEGDDGE